MKAYLMPVTGERNTLNEEKTVIEAEAIDGDRRDGPHGKGGYPCTETGILGLFLPVWYAHYGRGGEKNPEGRLVPYGVSLTWRSGASIYDFRG